MAHSIGAGGGGVNCAVPRPCVCLCFWCSLIHEELGRGAFGKVYRCTDKDDPSVNYAVKILNKSFLKRKRVGRFGNMLQTVKREVAIWKKLKHPHVVTLFEVIDDPGAAADWRTGRCTVLLTPLRALPLPQSTTICSLSMNLLAVDV